MTITTIRPASMAITNPPPISTTGAGGNPTTATSDNSDATYIQGNTDKQYIRFFLTHIATTLPANQRVRSCQIRIRTARDAVGGATQDTRTVLNNASAAHFGTCLGVGGIDVTRGVATIDTRAGPLAYAAPCGYAWDANQVNNLTIQTYFYRARTGAAGYQRVYELYCDVDINSQPIVSGAPTVTNYTNNATPTVTWLYSDPDLTYGQAAYRVKIYDAATYGAGNFNPDTTRPTWDSQIAYSTDNATYVPVALLNGVTYRAYVQVAKGWPGPQGAYWWSAWVPSGNFTVGFVAPAAPVIQLATVLADLNQYRAVLGVQVPLNLLTVDNASFEVSFGNWTIVANAGGVRDTTQHADGVASLKLTSTAAGDMVAQAGIDANGNPRVDEGKTYTFLASFKTAVSARSCAVGVQWVDSAGANIGGIVYGSNITDTTAGWTQASLTAVAPGNAFRAKVTVKVIATGAASEVHYVDQVDVHVGSSTTWTPGGYTNDQGDLLVERGEYLDDSRGPVDNWTHPQVGSCGTSMRNAGYGFNTNGTGTLIWRWLDKAILADGDTPAGMLDWYPSVATTPFLRFGEWTYGGTAYMMPVVASQSHTFSVWAWVDTGTVTVSPRINWRGADGTVLSTSSGTNVTVTTTPQRLLITAAAPGNAVLATGEIVLASSNQTQHVYVTRAGFGLGTLPVDGKPPAGIATGMTPTGLPLGVTWQPIRWREDGQSMATQGLAGINPGVNTGQVETFSDYEYVAGRPVLYRASISYSSAGQVLKSPYSNTAVIYGAPPTQTLLRSVTNPMLQVAVNRLKLSTVSGGFSGVVTYAHADDATVFHPLGADAGPVRVRDWVGGEDGTLYVVTSTEAQARRLMALISTNDVFEIQWAQGGRTYCVITGRSYSEVLSPDIDFCDADGQVQAWMRHDTYSLDYLETTAP